MAHLCQHVVLFEISQVSPNDSVAVVQQIERPVGGCGATGVRALPPFSGL